MIDNNDLDNQEISNENINNNQTPEENISAESLTVDYNNLYKLESDNEKEKKIVITNNDIQFDNADYIQDENIIKTKEKSETKHNLIFMGIVLIILITIILIVFPFIFKLKL